MSRIFKLRKNVKGQAIIEFALILPVLLMLILGVIEFGWLLNGKITINSAAREGARVGAVLNTTPVIRKQKVFETVEATIENSGVSITSANVNVIDEDDFVEDIHNIVVTLTGEIDPIIGLFVSDTVYMSSTARMRRE